MSQIRWQSNIKGADVHCVAGWDRPLQTLFLHVYIEPEDEDDMTEQCDLDIIDTLDLRRLAILEPMDIITLLQRHGCIYPARLYHMLLQHMKDNVGNVIVKFEEVPS